MNITELGAILAGTISILGILWRISDIFRKSENRLDERFAVLETRLDKMEGKIEVLLAFRKFPGD